MQLLRGQPAVDAARDILDGACPIPALTVDPGARDGGKLNLVALGTPDEAILIDAQGSVEVGGLIADCNKPLAADDAKRVHRALLAWCGRGPSRWACTRLSAQLLAAGRPIELDLASIAARYELAPPPPPDAGFEALGDNARAVATLIRRLIPDLQSRDMGWVSRIEASAVAPTAEMEHHGMPFDAAAWRRLAQSAEAERQELHKTLLSLFAPVRDADLFGAAVLNLDSDQEVKAALHALGHSVPDMRRGTLKDLPEPVGPPLRRFRELSKLTSTYGESFLDYVGADGRIHPTFELIGASTGRMACSAPNLQAVVKGGAHRACFHTSEDRRLIIGDYATCELRILAEMSGDPVFAEAFARGDDLHARVASEIFGKPVNKTQNPDLRERAKAIDFGLAYGMGAGGLGRQIGADLDTAQKLLERYFQTFPSIREFLEGAARIGLQRGYAVTMTGRRLILEYGGDRSSRAAAERIGKNMPIQGTSADITKIALARLRSALTTLHDAWLVNTVHDEIVVECDASEAEEARELVGREMEAAGAEVLKSIPLAVDAIISTAWDK